MRSLPTPILTLFAFGAAAALGSVPAGAEDDTSYGYVRSLEGTAVLHPADAASGSTREGGDFEAAERGVAINSPLLSRDRLTVDAGSRVELVLPDANVLRLGGQSSISLDSLAESADRDSLATRVTLYEGSLQWVARHGFGGDEWPRVDALNASFYLENGGQYLIESDGDRWSSVTVRQGRAEVVTERGSATLDAGEAMNVSGIDSPRLERRYAPRLSDIERWGERLEGDVRWSELQDIEPRYQYSAASLATSGSWAVIDGRRAWRPWRVRADWRPFVDGRWVFTPSGWTWVSVDAWGWTTSHYGSWDNVPGYGWAWFPGQSYAPAWVYWYWGDGNTGWCPTGYYTRHYRLGNSFRWGVYGWAGGSWNTYDDWTFCPTHLFGSRNLRTHCGRGSDYFRGRNGAPRGIVTTDTRVVTRDLLSRADGPATALSRLQRSGGDLPDVTSFVSRRTRDLPIDLGRVVTVPADSSRSGREPMPADGRSLDRRRVDAGDGRQGSSGIRGSEPAPGVSVRSSRSDSSARSAPSAPSDRSDRSDRSDHPVASDRAREPAQVTHPSVSQPTVVMPGEPRRLTAPAGDWRARAPREPGEPASARRDPGVREPYRLPDTTVKDVPVRRVVDGVRSSRPSSGPTVAPDRVSAPAVREPARASKTDGDSASGGGSNSSSGSSTSAGSGTADNSGQTRDTDRTDQTDRGSSQKGDRGSARSTARSTDRGDRPQKKDPPKP